MAGPEELAKLFTPELWDRLRWFVNLRWIAVAALAAASAGGPALGYPAAFPLLLFVALLVGVHNARLWWRLTRTDLSHWTPRALWRCALRQVVTDILALLVTVLATGGVASPVLPLFGFHMALGTMMLGAGTMFAVAAGAGAGLVGLHVAVAAGWVGAPERLVAKGWWNLGAMGVSMVALVYLTGTLMTRFTGRTRELDETSRRLQAHSAELQRLLESIREVEGRKSHYMRISAHQLRSPLATIKTALEVLAGGYVEPGTDQGRKLLRGALDRSSDLLTIVNDLLELAKVREGLSNAPWAREVNLNQLLADLFDSLGPAADEQRIRLVPEFEGIAVLDRGVPPDLVFAFHNVIDNGIKYSNEDGTVRVRLSVDDHVASVTVADDGIGIPPEFLDQVFLEFVRAPNARRHTIHGTGLGMAVVRDVIHAHGGTVAVDSDLGRGTTVVIRLPLHHGSANGADEDVSFR